MSKNASLKPVPDMRWARSRSSGPSLGFPAHGKSDRLGQLTDAIRELIAETGSMPPERAVAEQLNVKRHLLRQALASLRATGELQPARTGRRAHTVHRAVPLEVPQELDRPNRGEDLIRCSNPLEVMELRMVLEPALARLAALRASPAEIATIMSAATTAQGTSPSGADLVFHKAVAAGSRNMLASELYMLLYHVATDGRLRYAESDTTTSPVRIQQRDREHLMIAEAIAHRDPDAAERAMWEHLAVVQRKIMRRLVPGVDAA